MRSVRISWRRSWKRIGSSADGLALPPDLECPGQPSSAECNGSESRVKYNEIQPHPVSIRRNRIASEGMTGTRWSRLVVVSHAPAPRKLRHHGCSLAENIIDSRNLVGVMVGSLQGRPSIL